MAGLIDNTRSISVLAHGASESATAYGISVNDVSGTISNGGVITVTANQGTESRAFALGIDAGDLSGTILNTGTISVVANASTDNASAYGVSVNSVTEAGSISNQGLIDVSAQQLSSYAYAYGIYVSNDLDGNISNTGDIMVDAVMTDAYGGSAAGIYVGGDVNGAITNSGLLDVSVKTVQNTDDASAYGIFVAGDLTGSITNTATGVINVMARPGFGSGSANGIYVNGDVADGASILNQGAITIENHGFSDSVTSYGIYVGNDLFGSVTNAATGVINVNISSGSSSPDSYGIGVDSDVYGTVSNAGTISVKVATTEVNDGSDATAYGIYVSGNVVENDKYTGSVVNSGTITVNADGISGAVAYGVEVQGEMQGTLTNTATGVITVSATGGESNSVTAYGIYSYSISGIVTNAGTIDVSASDTGTESETDVLAYGIYSVDLFGGGEINNAGLIKVRGTSEGTSDYTAAGIWIDNAIHDGTVTNTGTIDVAFDSSSYYNAAYGIFAGEIQADGKIDNQGLITVSSTGSDSAFAYGIQVGSNGIAGEISNSGKIVVTAAPTGDSYAYAYGIKTTSTVSGTITNTGEITVSASTTGETSAVAFGIDVDNVSGTIANSGIIIVSADATSSYGFAGGIFGRNVATSGSIVNSGTIRVDSSNSSDSEATGVYAGSFEGYFENTGMIASNDVAFQLDSGEAGGSAFLSTGGFIEGMMIVDRAAVDVQGDQGMSVHWTLQDSDTLNGANTANNVVDTIAVFTRNLDGVAPEYATFDASSIAAGRQQGADSAMAGMGDLMARTSAATAVPAQVTSGPADAGGFKPFVNASSSRLNSAGNDTAMDQSVTTTALTVGGTKQTDGGLSLGLVAGTAMGATSVAGQWATASESTSNGAFAGASLASSMGNVTLTGGVTAGSVNFDNTRFVNDNLATDGIAEMASTNSDTYLAVQLDMTGRFAVGSDMALLPTAMVSYANHATTGYTEDGVDGATVDASAFGVAQGEFGLTMEKTLARGVLSLGVSQMTRSYSGGTSVDVGLIGDTGSVDATIPNASATKVSIGYTAGTVGSAQFNFGAETLLGAGGVTGGKIGGTISFRF